MIPVLLLVVIYARKDHLEDLHTQKAYGFLLKGYRKEMFFWEIIIMYRKIALVFFISLFSDNPLFQIMVFMCIIMISIVLQVRYKPYMNYYLNRVEFIVLTATLGLVYSGLYLISQERMNTTTEAIIWMVTVVSVACLVYFWLMFIKYFVTSKVTEHVEKSGGRKYIEYLPKYFAKVPFLKDYAKYKTEELKRQYQNEDRAMKLDIQNRLKANYEYLKTKHFVLEDRIL
jgi:hypothetical protein